MPADIYLKAGDTEPLDITVGATGLDDLTGISTVVMYAREKDSATNEVDGASCTIPDTSALVVRFDPAGNGPSSADAFASAGTYKVYLLLTHSDGDETRHPGSGFIRAIVGANYE